MNRELLKTDAVRCLTIMTILLYHNRAYKDMKDTRECLSLTEIKNEFGYKITIEDIEFLIDKYLFQMGICKKHFVYDKFLGYSL